ncbi:hypothetical protein DN062_02845 [Nitrincola tibetensis]|uniref:General secretion pathway protein GspK n=1 Tax=Nitrincola tibetensis TaxID=2219697 RepID=A0A364NQB6_9GAMM|nr:type II secretion system protein GspK [Nitrincola tibetensis]RAU19222.1 hypothetical protein DN062_02845 [Nitrincola tibetensis]
MASFQLIQAARLSKGVVLPMMLWLILALSLMVAGIATVAKMDARVVSHHVASAQAFQLAKGAVHLAMRDLQLARETGEYQGRIPFLVQYQFNQSQLSVTVMPITGLMNANRASEALLSLVFRQSLQMETDAADALAARWVAWRAPSEDNMSDEQDLGGRRFEVIEDIRQVAGVHFDVYERLKELVSVLPSNHSGIDPVAAPDTLLFALLDGDEAAFNRLITLRENDEVDHQSFDSISSQFLTSASSRGYRVDVRIETKTVFMHRFWVMLDSYDEKQPWRIVSF